MSSRKISASPREAQTPTLTVMAFGSLGMPIAALTLIINVYLPRHYVSLGVSFVAVASAFAIVRLIDVLFDPIVALLMDRTKTAIGRYRPWILGGAPIVMLGICKLLMPVGPVDGAYLILWLVVAFAGLSILNLGIASWSAVLARSYNDRSRVFTWLAALGVLGSLIILAMPILSHGKIVAGLKGSMPALGWILLVAVPATLLICTIFTAERVAVAAERSKFVLKDYLAALSRPTLWRLILADLALSLGAAAIGPIYVYFMHDVKNLTIADTGLLLVPMMGASLAGAPFWGWLARRIGKHFAVQLACLGYAAAQILLTALPSLPPHYRLLDCAPMILAVCLVGVATSCFLPMLRAMVADVVDEVKLHHNIDMTSLLFSMVTTTTKVGTSIVVAIVFPILTLIHFNGAEGAVNSPEAIRGLAWCFLLTPLVFLLLGAAMLVGYKLDKKRHAEILDALALAAPDSSGADLAAGGMAFSGPPPHEGPLPAR